MILHKYFYTVEAYLMSVTQLKYFLNRSKMVMGMISASITDTCWLPLLLRLVSGSSLHHLSESHAIRKICARSLQQTSVFSGANSLPLGTPPIRREPVGIDSSKWSGKGLPPSSAIALMVNVFLS